MMSNESFVFNGANVSKHPNNEMNTRKMLKFTVKGKPLPLRRHRLHKSGMYNPSSKDQESFRQALLKRFPSINGESLVPFFESSESLSMIIIFHMPRPLTHFIGKRRGPGRIRPNHDMNPRHVDVDNLGKFVLDALNQVAFYDDRQIVSLRLVKLFYTDERNKSGATEVLLERVNDSDLLSLITL